MFALISFYVKNFLTVPSSVSLLLIRYSKCILTWYLDLSLVDCCWTDRTTWAWSSPFSVKANRSYADVEEATSWQISAIRKFAGEVVLWSSWGINSPDIKYFWKMIRKQQNFRCYGFRNFISLVFFHVGIPWWKQQRKKETCYRSR